MLTPNEIEAVHTQLTTLAELLWQVCREEKIIQPCDEVGEEIFESGRPFEDLFKQAEVCASLRKAMLIKLYAPPISDA